MTVDVALARAGAEAVARGEASSVSAWVNAALADRVEKHRRLAALGAAIEAFEARHGKMTDEELAEQQLVRRKSTILIGARVKGGRRRVRRPRSVGATARAPRTQ